MYDKKAISVRANTNKDVATVCALCAIYLSTLAETEANTAKLMQGR